MGITAKPIGKMESILRKIENEKLKEQQANRKPHEKKVKEPKNS